MITRATVIKLLLRLASLLPLPVAHTLGAGLGSLVNFFDNSLRRVTQRNIDLCFPEWTPQQRSRLVRECLQETAKTVLETGGLWLWPPKHILAKVREVSGAFLLEEAMARGKGTILIGPHLGAWEMAGLYCGTLWPITALYRPPRIQGVDALIRGARERIGATLVPTNGGGIRTLYKALRRGELVGILPDQDPDREAGVFAPFFGVQANTMSLLPRLARKSGATVLLVYAERLPRGQGYHLHFLPTHENLHSDDPLVAARALNQAVEAGARALPSQYQWTYKRFKTRPPGEKNLY